LYYPTVTREPFRNQGRVTDLIQSGKLFGDLGMPALDPEHDRVMICGSPWVLKDLVAILDARGFEEGSSDGHGQYVIERAFVER
jgi:ferredoxin--NADP+ reductase